MKKIIILSMILILGLSLMAYAASMKIDFMWFKTTNIAKGCFAIVNYDPEDDTDAVIQIQVRGLTANKEHEVRSRQVSLGTFTTNERGSGHFHANISDDVYEELVAPFDEDFEDIVRRLNIYKDGERILWTEKFPE